MPIFVDLVGQSFGRLKVIGETKKRQSDGHKLWECLCECGEVTFASTNNLKQGNTTSCGCYHRERQKEVPFKHGGTGTPEYESWMNMRRRCNNPSCNEYKNYGGRGISVCPQWQDFAVFLSDMGKAPNGHSIERINNNGNYEPGNCRWATDAEQALNKRTNRILTFKGKSQTLKEWSVELGINYYTLHKRIQHGWTVERALTTP